MLTPGKLNSGEPVRYGPGQGYGLGLVLGSYRGLKTVGHSGIDWGYRAELLQFPEQRFSVIILGNLDTLEPSALARRVADVCLAQEFPEGPEGGPGRAARKPGPVALSEREAAVWAGTYWNLDTGASRTLAVTNGKLCLGARELTPLAADRFGIGGSPIELVFTPAREGMPRKMTWVDVDSEVFVALPELSLTQAALGEYAGTYRSDELNAVYTLRIRDGRLVVRGWRDEYGPLQAVVADGFSLKPPSLPPAFVRFTRDGQKQVTGFTLSTSGCKEIGFVKRAE
jgi:hypothetical protein